MLRLLLNTYGKLVMLMAVEQALLVARFGTSEGFWLGLQADYDLEETRHGIGKELLRVEQARAEYRVQRR